MRNTEFLFTLPSPDMDRLKIFLIRINLVSESFDSTQLMTLNDFKGIDSSQLTTQNEFIKFDSSRLTTQKASRIFRFNLTHDSKTLPRFWFKSAHDLNKSGILIWVKSESLNDSNQLLILLTFFGLSFNVVDLFWAFTQFRWPFFYWAFTQFRWLFWAFN